MSAIAFHSWLDLTSAANRALRFATRFWFVAAVLGQWAFMYYIFAFYGPSTLRGNFAEWSRNTHLLKGYVAGDTAGNLVFAAHALFAAVTSFGGALQLVPKIRQRAMALHRWNGRLFMVTALVVSVSGLYMTWVRGSRIGDGIAISINATLIIVCAVLAWRFAMRRDIAAHRRWAMRTYLVANGQWFMRVGMFAYVLVSRFVFGAAPKGLAGPFASFWVYGCYLVPLAVLELYFLASNARPHWRFAMAGALVVLTLLMSLGTFAVAAFIWRPLL